MPEQIGEYHLIRLIGRGGMGEVWLASREGLVKPCALKVLRPEYALNEEYRRRFLREARIMSMLRNNRIVSVFDFGEADGYYYLAMDYIDGVDLRTLCEALARQGRRLPYGIVIYIMGEVFTALHHAHNRVIDEIHHGVIHRDVTPDNVLISSEGEVFLTDFGIARFGKDGSAEMFGKFQYLAPEQALGTATYRSDIYSACGMLHYMLTGEPPRLAYGYADFRARTHPEIRSTGRADVPEPLERLRVAGLEPEPERRLASARDGLLVLGRYHNLATALADIYRHLIGPVHSGWTDIMPAARQPSPEEPVNREPPRPRKRRFAAAPPKPRPAQASEEDQHGDEPRDEHGDENGDEHTELEDQKTTMFVEADAPRQLRRPPKIRPPADPPRQDPTQPQQPVTPARPPSAPHEGTVTLPRPGASPPRRDSASGVAPTVPLSSLGDEAEGPAPWVTPRLDGLGDASLPDERALDERAPDERAPKEQAGSEPDSDGPDAPRAPAGEALEEPRRARASKRVQATSRPWPRRDLAAIAFMVAFGLVMAALVVGLLASYDSFSTEWP